MLMAAPYSDSQSFITISLIYESFFQSVAYIAPPRDMDVDESDDGETSVLEDSIINDLS